MTYIFISQADFHDALEKSMELLWILFEWLQIRIKSDLLVIKHIYQIYLLSKHFFIILLRSSNVLWQTLYHKLNLYTLTSVIAYSLTGLQNKAILLVLISQEASEKDKLNNLPWMRCIVLSMSPPSLPTNRTKIFFLDSFGAPVKTSGWREAQWQ